MSCGAKPQAGKSYCPNCGNPTSELAEICVKCGAKLVPEASKKAPALLPGVISAYKYGWNKLWPNFGILLLIVIVTYAVSAGTSLIINLIVHRSPYFSYLSLFISLPLSYGLAFCFLKASREGDVKFEEMFTGFKYYWNTIAAGLLSGLIVLGGIILLIVPGIIFACRLAFVPYLVVDRKLGPVEAIQTSWKMTKGHAMEVFLIGLLGIPIVIAGLICLVVGVIVSSMWISMAVASLYYAVSDEKENELKPAV